MRAFEIPGKIQAKQRPRFNGVYAYTPEKTINYENWIKTCYLQKYKNEKIFEGPLSVSIFAYYEIPKNTSKKKKEEMLNYKIYPTIRPDTDNIAKSILDALNGIAYKDDKQIVKLYINKVYGDNAGAKVLIDDEIGE